jgi:hypothetical protein
VAVASCLVKRADDSPRVGKVRVYRGEATQGEKAGVGAASRCFVEEIVDDLMWMFEVHLGESGAAFIPAARPASRQGRAAKR